MTVSAPGVIVETARLRIRAKTTADAIDEYRWRRDPELARFDAAAPVATSYRQFLDQFEREQRFPNPTRRAYALDNAEGEHVGSVMYYNADHGGGSAEFGISIGSGENLGRGLGTAATIAFVRHIWGAYPFRFLYLHTLDWNERALRCFARAGFGETARVQRKGDWFVRMEARREWWLLWDAEGRFAAAEALPVSVSEG